MNTIENISIENIAVSGLNDRAVFNTQSIEELTNSVLEHGILQNLIVRKNGKPGHFELVAGERRLIAAKAAKLETVPCSVRVLNDLEFKQVMLIENLQREDIHPLDEAKSFQRLIDDKLNEKQIALKIGKSLIHVKKRLALNGLSVQANALFVENKMQLGHAQILCLFTNAQQNEAIESVMQGDDDFSYFDHPSDLSAWMRQHVLRKLSTALFDVSDVKLVNKVGACSNCPKQTACNTELFAHITPEAQCMDAECFSLKTETFAHKLSSTLLKQIGIKKEDCPTITTDNYSYDGDLNCDKWRAAGSPTECPNVTVGFSTQWKQPEIAKLICINPKCEIHFDQSLRESSSLIPNNESKPEEIERKMNNRRAKQNREDIHAARKEFMHSAAKSTAETLISFELRYLITVMINRSREKALDLATSIGFVEKSHDYYWTEKFLDFLKKKGNQITVSYLRTLILHENLHEYDKFIDQRDPGTDDLLIHGKALKVNFAPLLKAKKDARKADYKIENDLLKSIIQKEKDKAAKIGQLIKEAKEEYPELYKIIQSKDRKFALGKLSVEMLSKMAFRLGLKRKKNGDANYYINTLTQGLDSLISNT